MIPLYQSFNPSNLGHNTIQVRPHLVQTCPPSILRALLRSTSTSLCAHKEQELQHVLARKYLIVTILKPKVFSGNNINTHVANLLTK